MKLKFLFSGHVMGRADSLEKTLMLVKTVSKRRRGRQKMRWSESITDSMDMNLSKLQERAEHRAAQAGCWPRRSKESDMGKKNKKSCQVSKKDYVPQLLTKQKKLLKCGFPCSLGNYYFCSTLIVFLQYYFYGTSRPCTWITPFNLQNNPKSRGNGSLCKIKVIKTFEEANTINQISLMK